MWYNWLCVFCSTRGLFSPIIKVERDEANGSALEAWAMTASPGTACSLHQQQKLFHVSDISFTNTHQPGCFFEWSRENIFCLQQPAALVQTGWAAAVVMKVLGCWWFLLSHKCLTSKEKVLLYLSGGDFEKGWFSVLFVGLKPGGSLGEAIDFDSCNLWQNRSMSSKSLDLCKEQGRRAVFQETMERRKELKTNKQTNLSLPSHLFFLKLHTKHGASEPEKKKKIFNLSSTDQKYRQSPTLTEPP